jgi:hypothetical protein
LTPYGRGNAPGVPPPAGDASRSVYGAPDWEVEGWVTSYTAIAAGELDLVTDTVERLAGHPPVRLADYVRRLT